MPAAPAAFDGLTFLQRGWLSSNNVLLHGAPGEGATLVDSGHCAHAQQTLALVRHGLGDEPLARIVNTHLHSDHCGGNATLQRAFAATPVVIPPGQWDAVQRWDEDALSYRPTRQRCERFTADAVLAPGATLRCGGRAWEVLAAPGHDPHSVILFDAAHGVLISADALWERIDEQKFDAELRRKLVANGLRVGIVGGALPEDLAKLLELDGDAAETSDSQLITAQSAVPRVTRRVVQVKRPDPISIKVSELRDEAQVLLSQEGSFGGKTFRQMEGVYSLQAERVPGQRVNVRLTPELHHGDLKQRFAGSQQGIFMSIPSREREVFDDLSMDVTLAPGELLVLGCLPAAKTSLGGKFDLKSFHDTALAAGGVPLSVLERIVDGWVATQAPA